MHDRKIVPALLLALVLAVACVAPAIASAKSAPIEASGMWSWEGDTWIERDHPNGSFMAMGDENGVWTGTISGPSHEDFVAQWDKAGDLRATLWSTFTGAELNGAHGDMTMRISCVAPADGSFFGGEWKILTGTEGLTHVRGEGTWWGADDGVHYSGLIWEQ